MFVGFNATINETDIVAPGFFQHGIELYNKQKKKAKEILENYTLSNGVLDASRIENDWFPSISADVFISHAHKDRDLAISLAGWFSELFGIQSFIDSCVWGHMDDLLSAIDETYCVSQKNSDGSVLYYDYLKRNQSTAHVHMILNTALHKMIDKTECLIFLNTPNSLMLNDVIEGKATASPWIYSELTFSQLCRKRKLAEYRKHITHGTLYEYNKLEVRYDVSTDHLVTLSGNDIMSMWIQDKMKPPYEVLDNLYTRKKVI